MQRPRQLTLDVPVNDALAVEKVHCSQEVSGVPSDHVFGKTLLRDGPQRSLVAVLHEQKQLRLRVRGHTYN